MVMHTNLSDAVSKKKAYTIQNPEAFINVIEEFTLLKQECDSLKSEQEKLLRVLASLQTMAETVQKIIQE
jgi:predicted DNA-binding protein